MVPQNVHIRPNLSSSTVSGMGMGMGAGMGTGNGQAFLGQNTSQMLDTHHFGGLDASAAAKQMAALSAAHLARLNSRSSAVVGGGGGGSGGGGGGGGREGGGGTGHASGTAHGGGSHTHGGVGGSTPVVVGSFGGGLGGQGHMNAGTNANGNLNLNMNVGGLTHDPVGMDGLGIPSQSLQGQFGVQHSGGTGAHTQSILSELPSHHLSASHPASRSNAIPSTNPSSSAHPQPITLTALKQRQRNFLTGLAGVHMARNTPLPPALTGIPYPAGYEANNWKSLEVGSDVGIVRISGKDVDLFRLWGFVFQAGGGAKITQQQAWHHLIHHFDLPEYLPMPHSSGERSAALMLGEMYMTILYPFEEVYKRQLQDQHRKAVMAGRLPAGSAPQVPPGSTGSTGTGQAGLAGAHQSAMMGSGSGTFASSHSMQNGGGVMGSSMAGGHVAPGEGVGGAGAGAGGNFVPPNHQRALSSGPGSASIPSSSSLAIPNGSADVGGFGSGLHQQQTAANGLFNGHGGHGPGGGKSGLDGREGEGIAGKRKLEFGEDGGKRTRMKLGGSEPPETPSSLNRTSLPPVASSSNLAGPSSAGMSRPTKSKAQLVRHKVTYVPLNREVDTYGGRDLKALEEEYQRAQRRPLRDINDWGIVDIEALAMSLRSRLSTELSYALTTLTLISTMRGQTPGSGFPLVQATDLFEEVLDLLEDEAFGDVRDSETYTLPERVSTVTHKSLVDTVVEAETLPFAGLENRQGGKDPEMGPKQRPGSIILAIFNILRNLSVIADNTPFLAQHERMLDLILRVCGVEATEEGRPARAVSSALSLADVTRVRKDTLQILSTVGGAVHLNAGQQPLAGITARIASRAFELLSSFLVDPADAVSPAVLHKKNGAPSHQSRPPSLVDIALEVFTRLGHPDQNRQVFSVVVPPSWIWQMLQSLIHRLPLSDSDFQLLTHEIWLSYMEKTVMSIYALVFLSPPELKERIKGDRKLAFSRVMLRVVQRLLVGGNTQTRNWFMVCAKRAVEAMKVVDEGEDAFDTSHSTVVPTMSFGMGWGEAGETGVEKGTGLLGGRREVAWDILMRVDMDAEMFAELESLTRVESC